MDFPKISIVTPSFNQGQYIEQTILSILNQNYPNLEYIIIDGGSTDNTIEIIKKYEQHIFNWVSEPDKGQSDALNKGLSRCTGDIFNWVNSDDFLEPGALFSIAELFMQDEKASLVCGFSSIFNSADNKVLFTNRTTYLSTIEQTMVAGSFNKQAMFYRLACVKQIGGVNTELHYIMDLELFFKYLLQFGLSNIKISDKLFAHFRLHGDSKTIADSQKFTREKYSLFSYLLKTKINNCFQQYFEIDTYRSLQPWKFGRLNISRFIGELSKKYFFEIYTSGNKCAAKYAFKKMMTHTGFKFSFLYLRIFIKLFVVNLRFNYLIKKNGSSN